MVLRVCRCRIPLTYLGSTYTVLPQATGRATRHRQQQDWAKLPTNQSLWATLVPASTTGAMSSHLMCAPFRVLIPPLFMNEIMQQSNQRLAKDFRYDSPSEPFAHPPGFLHFKLTKRIELRSNHMNVRKTQRFTQSCIAPPMAKGRGPTPGPCLSLQVVPCSKFSNTSFGRRVTTRDDA